MGAQLNSMIGAMGNRPTFADAYYGRKKEIATEQRNALADSATQQSTQIQQQQNTRAQATHDQGQSDGYKKEVMPSLQWLNEQPAEQRAQLYAQHVLPFAQKAAQKYGITLPPESAQFNQQKIDMALQGSKKNSFTAEITVSNILASTPASIAIYRESGDPLDLRPLKKGTDGKDVRIKDSWRYTPESLAESEANGMKQSLLRLRDGVEEKKGDNVNVIYKGELVNAVATGSGHYEDERTGKRIYGAVKAPTQNQNEDVQPGGLIKASGKDAQTKDLIEMSAGLNAFVADANGVLEILEKHENAATGIAGLAKMGVNLMANARAASQSFGVPVPEDLFNPDNYDWGALASSNAGIRSAMLGMAISAAAADGTSGKALSDNDVKRYLVRVGAYESDPSLIRSRMSTTLTQQQNKYNARLEAAKKAGVASNLEANTQTLTTPGESAELTRLRERFKVGKK
jgi:hypothetical protein